MGHLARAVLALGAGLVLGGLALSAPARAITLSNRDSGEHKLTVIEGDKQSERTIKPGEKLELCPQSCVIRMPDGEDYEFDGGETVLIEDGLLVLDTAEGQAKPNR